MSTIPLSSRRGAPVFAVLAILTASLPSAAQRPPKPELSEIEPDSLRRFESRDTVRTEADEMTLREIIERCVQGEKTKLAGIHDMTFTSQVRSIITWKNKRMVWEGVYLTYEDDTGFGKSVELATKERQYKKDGDAWVLDEKENDDDSSLEVEAEADDRGKDLARLPFFLEDQSDYDFELLDRFLEEDHVIFKIRFRPKSSFKPLPSGTVYVDTDRFRIVHEEFSFEGESPFPLLVKDIKRISRHWRELTTGEWVTWKILAEMTFRGSWMKVIPEKAEVMVLLDDYRFDQGYDEHRFGPREEK